MSTTESDTTTDSSTDSDTSFRAIVDADVLGTHLDVLGSVVDEFVIEPAEDGFLSRAVESANALMVDAQLGADEFHEYVPGQLLGVRVDKLETAVGLADGDEPITLDLDTEKRRLVVTGNDFDYEIALIDPDAIRNRPDIPDLDIEASFNLEASELERVKKGCDEIGDRISIETPDDSSVRFSGYGDTDDLSFTFTADDKLGGIDAVRGVSSDYGIEYFGYMTSVAAGPVDVELASGHPVSMNFERRGTTATMMLAPRVDGGR